SAFMHEIVEIKILGYTFIDKKFWEGLSIVPIILMAYVLSAAYTQMSIWFKLTKQTHFALYFTGTGAIITLLLNVLTIPWWGYYGSAWATLISYLVMTIMVYISGQKHFPVPYKIKTAIMYAFICTGGYALCHFAGHSNANSVLLKLLITFGITGGIYLFEKKYSQ
ncbi:MAG: polysaccharide biosynthesis C-terminal domain-containing protein, partial [Bacteroidia bacterium]|nr:polysaccharide biosynthesis C-terminal domain-containing protein [Bacteroidia bacterium]